MAKTDEQVPYLCFERCSFLPLGDYIPPPEKANCLQFRAQKPAGASAEASVPLSFSFSRV